MGNQLERIILYTVNIIFTSQGQQTNCYHVASIWQKTKMFFAAGEHVERSEINRTD